MAAELRVKIRIDDVQGKPAFEKTLVGSAKEIEKEFKKITLKDLPREAAVTGAALKDMRRQLSANLQELKKTGGGMIHLKRLAKGIKAELTPKGKLIFRDIASGAQISKKAMQKLILEETKLQRNSKKAELTLAALGRQIRKSFSAQQTALLQKHSNKIAQLRGRMSVAGDASGELKNKIKTLQDEMQRINQVKSKSFFPDLANATREELEETDAEIKKFFSEQNSRFQGVSGARAGAPPSFKDKLQGVARQFKQIGAQLSGALGFGLVTAGIEIQNAFRNKRFQGQLAGGAKMIASQLGSALGSAIGSIAGDIGHAVGLIGEAIINVLTLKMRLIGSAVGAAIRGVGLLVISGLATLPGLVGLGLTPLFVGLAAALPALLVPIGFVLLTLVTDIIAEITDLVDKLFKSILSLISAGLKIVGSVVKVSLGAVLKIWTALWKGFKEVVVSVFEGIKTIVETGLQLVSSLVKNGTKDFLELQAGATRAAKEVANQSNQINRLIGDINSARVRFGFDRKDASAAAFDIISSGLRSINEQQMLLSVSSKLATADQSTLANATNALITVYQNYGEGLKSVNRISKLLSTATTLGRTSLEELGPSLRSVVGIAKFAGVGIEDLLASITALTRVFGRGSTQSTTRFLSRFIESIAFPASTARKEFEKLGVSIEDLQGKGFGDKFVNLLEKLKGISPDNLRDIFRTNQSRKAFAGLTLRAEEFKKILNDIKRLNNLQGQQLKVIFTTAAQRMKLLEQQTLVVREGFGKLVSDFFMTNILSDKFLTVLIAIGDLVSGEKFLGSIEKWAKFISVIADPLEGAILSALRKIGALMRDISNTNPFEIAPLVEFGRNLRELFATVVDYIRGINLGKIILVSVLASIDLINKAFTKTKTLINQITTGKFDFEKVKQDVKELVNILGKIGVNSLNLGLSKISEGILKASRVVDNFDSDKFKGIEISPEAQSVIDSFKNIFSAIKTLATSSVDAFIEEIVPKLSEAFANSSNVLVQNIKDTMRFVLNIAEIIDNIIRLGLAFLRAISETFLLIKGLAPAIKAGFMAIANALEMVIDELPETALTEGIRKARETFGVDTDKVNRNPVEEFNKATARGEIDVKRHNERQNALAKTIESQRILVKELEKLTKAIVDSNLSKDFVQSTRDTVKESIDTAKSQAEELAKEAERKAKSDLARREKAVTRKRKKGTIPFTPIQALAKGTDSVPAMLTPGEAVIPADAVTFFGQDFMKSIINKRVPGFASGTSGGNGSSGSSLVARSQAARANAPQTSPLGDIWSPLKEIAKNTKEQAKGTKTFLRHRGQDGLMRDKLQTTEAERNAAGDRGNLGEIFKKAAQTNRGVFGINNRSASDPNLTRSGRIKGKRSDITSGFASFFEGGPSKTKGVSRVLSGRSLFDSEQAMFSGGSGLGGRFQGQSAHGILRQGRGSRTISPLESRTLPEKDKQSKATQANTIATESLTDATRKNTAKQHEVKQSLDKAVAYWTPKGNVTVAPHENRENSSNAPTVQEAPGS